MNESDPTLTAGAAGPPAAPGPPPDRWAHRRTEPRPLAFLWTTFLAVASAITLATLVAQGASGHDVYRPAARGLFAVLAVGLTVLWPMLRLSQAVTPGSTAASVAKDVSVLIAPAQAVLWPQAMFFLADWPVVVIGACAAILAAWTLLIGAVLALALAHVRAKERSGLTAARRRTLWTLAVVLLAGIGPVFGIGPDDDVDHAARAGDARAPLLTSPVTAVLEITSDRSWSGKSAAALPLHWSAVWVTLAVSGVLWIVGTPLRRRLDSSTDTETGPEAPDGIQTSQKEPLQGAAADPPGSGPPTPLA